MKANKHQKQYIYKLSGYNKNTKEEWVQWATNDNSITSTNALTFEEANAIIKQAGGVPSTKRDPETNWAYFDKDNGQHKYILSLCRQLNWQSPHKTLGKVVDLERLSNWLKSERSPVNKPLQKMTASQVSKVIAALEGIIKSKYK